MFCHSSICEGYIFCRFHNLAVTYGYGRSTKDRLSPKVIVRQPWVEYQAVNLFYALPFTFRYLPIVKFKIMVKKFLVEQCSYSVNDYFEAVKLGFDKMVLELRVCDNLLISCVFMF